MNPRNFGGSLWLLFFGAASILLIGAVTRFDGNVQPENPAAVNTATATVIEGTPVPNGPTAVAQLPSDLSPGLADIIKMAQSRVPEDTILAYIQNSGASYKLSADEIIYLTDLGVSDRVLSALLKRPETTMPANAASAMASASPVPAAPPIPAALPTPAVLPTGVTPPDDEGLIDVPPTAPVVEVAPVLQNPRDSYFYDGLAPYGRWLQTDDGWGWQPAVAHADESWMPYSDRGQWLLTDNGWYWQSDYSWGWAPFHYGRWRHHERVGWVWIPGHIWAPAWVAWRNTDDGFAGWAPLPPGVVFDPSVGLITMAGLGGLEVSYGLKAAVFIFVPQRNFLEHNPGRFAAGSGERQHLFASSKPVKNYSVTGGKILNLGVSPTQIAAATKKPVLKAELRDASSPEFATVWTSGRSLTVFRPDSTTLKSPAASAQSFVDISRTARAMAAITADTAPGSTSATTPTRSGIGRGSSLGRGFGGNFQLPDSRTASASGATWQSSDGAPATRINVPRNLAMPSSPAPQVGYPTYPQRSVSPVPPSLPGRAQFDSTTLLISPGYNSLANPANRQSLAPDRSVKEASSRDLTSPNQPGSSAPRADLQHNASAPVPAESHSGSGQANQGSNSQGSGSQSNSNKTGK